MSCRVAISTKMAIRSESRAEGSASRLRRKSQLAFDNLTPIFGVRRPGGALDLPDLSGCNPFGVRRPGGALDLPDLSGCNPFWSAPTRRRFEPARPVGLQPRYHERRGTLAHAPDRHGTPERLCELGTRANPPAPGGSRRECGAGRAKLAGVRRFLPGHTPVATAECAVTSKLMEPILMAALG